ncbi:hypothetical protein C8F01DRAFT_1257751 [Mycena amicta]|nr:hypothetical protein C8F01DRAFT_1257751 [Mycena amicta]
MPPTWAPQQPGEPTAQGFPYENLTACCHHSYHRCLRSGHAGARAMLGSLYINSNQPYQQVNDAGIPLPGSFRTTPLEHPLPAYSTPKSRPPCYPGSFRKTVAPAAAATLPLREQQLLLLATTGNLLPNLFVVLFAVSRRHLLRRTR